MLNQHSSPATAASSPTPTPNNKRVRSIEMFKLLEPYQQQALLSALLLSKHILNETKDEFGLIVIQFTNLLSIELNPAA